MMVSRNTVKVDIPDSYYHIYARGASRQPIFLDEQDYRVFLSLLERYLSPHEIRDAAGMPYDKLIDDISLLCYCLMRNHFHLLVYQVHEHTMTRLMRGVMTSYSRYFNKKYQRSGSLFESRYKASRISSDEYLLHISRYIHLNPKQWRDYPHSSLVYYIGGGPAPDWLQPERIQDLFSDAATYEEFLADYEAVKDSLKRVKHELADQ